MEMGNCSRKSEKILVRQTKCSIKFDVQVHGTVSINHYPKANVGNLWTKLL